MNNTVRIISKMMLLVGILLCSATAMAQNVQVSGTVVDIKGEPIIGATVSVAGTSTGAVTDLDGRFQVNAPKGKTLTITYVGYKSQEVKITEQKDLDITLVEDSKSLDDVVVVGYGVQKKSSLTSAISSVKADDLVATSITSFDQGLQGRASGVVVLNTSGQPGGATSIRIRGTSSINGNNEPLYVIDGIPIISDASSITTSTLKSPALNPLTSINPNDIESIEVLKDASATAIYGSRGSNGVIIITTKKGRKDQKPHVSYSGTVGVSTNLKQLDVMNADEYRSFIKSYYGEGSDAYALLGTSDTNWQNEIYQSALNHEHNLTLTGGFKNMPYRVSLGYLDQEGVLKTSDYERYTASVSLNPSFFDDHLNFNFNGRVMHSNTRWANTGAIGSAVRFDPTQPIYAKDDAKYAQFAADYNNFGGYYEWLTDGSSLKDNTWKYDHNSNTTANPVSQLMNTENTGKNNTFIGNAEMDYKFHGFEDLRFHVNGSVEYNKGRTENWSNPYSYVGAYYGWNEWNKETRYNMSYSAYLQYYKDFSDAHHFDIMGGYEWSHKHYQGDNYGYGLVPNTNNDASIRGTEVNTTGKPWEGESYLESVFGRANYILLDRYIFTATVRYDGSSRFSKGHKWGLFPSFAFAWRIKDENFLKNVDWVSELKLRLGYGETGQQDGISNYSYFASYNVNSVADSFYPAMGNGTIYRPDAYNKALTWETTTTYNVGLDFGIINNKLFGSVDAYLRKTTDLINTVYVAALSNFRNQVTGNIGDMENKGIEVALTYRPISNGDWFWEISANATYNLNKITKTAGGQIIKTGGISAGTGNTVQAHAEGHPKSSFYVYQQVYDQDGKALEGVYVDRNADGQITEADRYFYKSPDAPLQAGLSTKLQYKHWDLGLGLRGSWGNYVYNDTEAGFVNVYKTYDSSFGYTHNIINSAANLNWATYDNVVSDYFVQNGSFVKLDNITLGYSFDHFLHSGKYEGMNGRIYAAATNVACWSKYKGMDAEVSGGIDNNLYPRPFTVQLGLNINF